MLGPLVSRVRPERSVLRRPRCAWVEVSNRQVGASHPGGREGAQASPLRQALAPLDASWVRVGTAAKVLLALDVGALLQKDVGQVKCQKICDVCYLEVRPRGEEESTPLLVAAVSHRGRNPDLSKGKLWDYYERNLIDFDDIVIRMRQVFFFLRTVCFCFARAFYSLRVRHRKTAKNW